MTILVGPTRTGEVMAYTAAADSHAAIGPTPRSAVVALLDYIDSEAARVREDAAKGAAALAL